MVSFCESCKHYCVIGDDGFCCKADNKFQVSPLRERCEDYIANADNEDWYALAVVGSGYTNVSLCNGNYFTENKVSKHTDNLVFKNIENANNYIKYNDIGIKCKPERFLIVKEFADLLIKGDL